MLANEYSLIEHLAEKIASRVANIVPIDVAYWDISRIAAALNRTPAVVRQRIACLPDFPKARRLPSDTDRGAQPLYKATEVIEWVEKHKDKN